MKLWVLFILIVERSLLLPHDTLIHPFILCLFAKREEWQIADLSILGIEQLTC